MIRYLTLLLVTLFLFDSCSKQRAPQTSSSTSNVGKNNFKGNVSLSAGATPSSGKNASDFYWYDSNGKKISLSGLKGKTVLINFWATWCGPCKAELPDIESLSKTYASRGLVVIGVSVDKGGSLLSDVSDFASRNGLTYQIVIDNDDVADAYGNVNAIPTSFLVDKNGKIVDKWIGMRDKEFLESTAKKYLD
ncbi:MAG TPA: TlpA disulfide reductase family protein [Candidatus Acidoferrales bacterium]|nr:TlpA disulfide reductase family protein [Candidatus Acidoferrales bacterium]